MPAAPIIDSGVDVVTKDNVDAVRATVEKDGRDKARVPECQVRRVPGVSETRHGMKISRAEFFQLVAGGSAWLVSSGFAQKIKLAVADTARPLPLTAVRLTGGPLKKAQDLDAAYLLSLDPDRMLAFYRKRAGLPHEGGGLHRMGRRRPPAHRPHCRPSPLGRQPDVCRDRRRALQAARRLHRLRDQDRARTRTATDSPARFQACKEAFAEVSKGNIKAANFDLNGLWSPWYTLHKTFAGLRDAYRHTGNHDRARRRSEVRRMGREASRADGRCDDPAHAGLRVRRHERDDGRPVRRHRRQALARSLLQVRAQGRPRSAEARRGSARAACTATRKCRSCVGSASRYAYAGNKDDLTAADGLLGSRRQSPHLRHRRTRQGRVLPRARQAGQHHRRPHGGDLQRLQHAEADAQAVRDAARHPATPSSTSARCSITSSARWITDDGATCYMVPVGRACAASTPDMHRSFTCCVGTGMESHALHGLGLYYESRRSGSG